MRPARTQAPAAGGGTECDGTGIEYAAARAVHRAAAGECEAAACGGGGARLWPTRAAGACTTHDRSRRCCCLADRGSQPFPDLAAGNEAGSLSYDLRGTPAIDVDVRTVDELIAAAALPAPQVLLVDAEGNDARVLEGAALALRSTHFVEFEHHLIGAWRSSHLRDTISMLDRTGFDCFWQTRSGDLWRITRCWDERYEAGHPLRRDRTMKRWSNVACARRGSRWHDAMRPYDVAAMEWSSPRPYPLSQGGAGCSPCPEPARARSDCSPC